MKDYFSILNLPRYATEEQIKEAYRRLAMRWHPDANPLDVDAERRMQDLNRAKEVLFDKETREEYKRVLDMQDQLSLENLQRLRKKYRESKNAESTTIEYEYPYDRRKSFFGIGLLIVAVIGAFFFIPSTKNKQAENDPVQNIIERHTPIGTSAPAVTSGVDSTAPTETLERRAIVSAMLDDYRTAATYWEYLLQKREYHLATATSLALAYLKFKDYSSAFSVIDRFVLSPKDKLILYTTLGDYFKSELLPVDAKDAYRKALELVTIVDTTDLIVIEALTRAQEGSN